MCMKSFQEIVVAVRSITVINQHHNYNKSKNNFEVFFDFACPYHTNENIKLIKGKNG